MSVAETLIPAGVGLVVGLVPFGYTVHRDRRERHERAKADARKELEEQRQALERQREQMRAVKTRYLDLLGKAMALLEAVLVDADNADQLLWGATGAKAELEGLGQGDLFVTFGASPPVIWSDHVCRTLLRSGLTMAGDARAQRQTGDAARETQRALRQLTTIGIDAAGPRDLFRWASDEAIKRWPQPLTSFEDEPRANGAVPWGEIARAVADGADVELCPSSWLRSPRTSRSRLRSSRPGPGHRERRGAR